MEIESTSSTNPNAVISLIAALLTILSFCIGFAPIPFTSLVCYPLSLLASIVALTMGFVALGQVRRTGQKGRALALAGIWLGGLTVLFIFCFSTIAILFLPRLLEYILRDWQQFHPTFQSANLSLRIPCASIMLVSGSG